MLTRAPDVTALVGRSDETRRVVAGLRGDGTADRPRRSGVVVRAGPVGGGGEFARAAAGPRAVCLDADDVTATIPLACLAPLAPLGFQEVRLDDAVFTALSLLQGAVSTAVDERGQDAVVVVDDAAHLDAATAVALAELSARGVALVLATSRVSSLPAPLARAARRFDVIELPDLSDAGISELAGAVLGGPVEPRVIRSLSHCVGGAPTAIVEVLRFAAEEGSIESSTSVWRQVADLRLPSSLIDTYATITSTLTEPQTDALDVVALGLSVAVEVVIAVVGDDALLGLEAHDLVRIRTADDGTVATVSTVDRALASARLQAMGGLRRRSLALRLDSELRRRSADSGDDAEAITRAAVRLAAGDPLDARKALDVAKAARRIGELPLAVRLCETVERTSTDLLILLAELLTESGRNREAEAALRDLVGDTEEQRALIAMTRVVNLAFHLDEVDAAHAVLERALDDLHPGPWMSEVVGLGGVLELMLGRPVEAIRRVEGFLDRSGREFVEAATAAGPALAVMGRCLAAADLAQRSLDERMSLGDQSFLESAGLHAVVRAFGLAEAGRFAEADELTEFVLHAASDMAVANGVLWSGVVRGRSLLDQGRFPEAAGVFGRAASAALDLNLALHGSWARGGALLAVAQMGDEAQVRSALDTLDSLPPTRLGMMASEVERSRAWASIALGDLSSGAAGLSEAADAAVAGGETGMAVHALHDLVRIGRSESVERLVALRNEVEGELHAARVAHGLALADRDVAGLVAVADAFESCGALVLAAEAANHASWCARRRDQATLADGLRRRVTALRGLRPWAATPGLASHPRLAELTGREREVAWLVGAGSSSKEVAQRLGVSVRTVDNLLQRVYRKLGISGRADLRELRLA